MLSSQQLARGCDAGRHRLFDQDVLACLKPGLRELGMLIHAGQHEHRIDIVTRDELRRRGGRRDRRMHGRDGRGLVAVDVECGGQSRLAALLELANQLAVGPQEDATESEYSESKHVSVSLMEGSTIPVVARDSDWACRAGRERGRTRTRVRGAAARTGWDRRRGPFVHRGWSPRPPAVRKRFPAHQAPVPQRRSPCESAEISSCGNTGPRWLPGMNRMQPFSSVAGCSASQMLTRTVGVSRIPVRFVLVPGRGAADPGRLQDGVIAGRHAVGPQQLPGDFPRIAIRQSLDQSRRIALRVDDLRQRRARERQHSIRCDRRHRIRRPDRNNSSYRPRAGPRARRRR